MKIKRRFWTRILLFGLLNLAVFATLYILTSGEITYLLPILMIYACTMPFINLLFSRYFAKKAFSLTILDPNVQYENIYEWYHATTYHLAQKAGMKKMPELAVYEANDMNAFATGRSKNSSLIAVSTALLYDMDDAGIEAVIAHEISHIVNGDMVTQTLLQSFLNTIMSTILLPFTIMRWFFYLFADNDSTWLAWLVYICEFLLTVVLLFVAGLIAKMYSRKREFGADYLAAQLTHPAKMISALRQLQDAPNLLPQQKKYAALQFNGKQRVLDLFSTYPSIERRIKYLQKNFKKI